MTTILGIKTNSVLESIIIASDRQRSDEEDESKRPIPKIYTGKYWVMGDAGSDDRDIKRFYGRLRGDVRYFTRDELEKIPDPEEYAKSMIDAAIKNERFIEIDELNAKLLKKGEDIDCTHKFILAVNRPYSDLWLIDQFGNLKRPSEDNDIDYVCIGSGEESAVQYIRNQIADGRVDRENFSTGSAIRLTEGAVVAAHKDLWSGLGTDIWVLTRHDIKQVSKQVDKDMEEAKQRRIETICQSYEERERTEMEKQKEAPASASLNNAVESKQLHISTS